jgi:iron-sulfur cluster assembly accessory protein
MLNLTESAQTAVGGFMQKAEQPVSGLRVSISGGGCSGFQYGMALEAEPKEDDMVMEFGEVKVFVDPISAAMLEGVTIDFVDSLEGSGFKFENPNATNTCGCGSSFSA